VRAATRCVIGGSDLTTTLEGGVEGVRVRVESGSGFAILRGACVSTGGDTTQPLGTHHGGCGDPHAGGSTVGWLSGKFEPRSFRAPLHRFSDVS
jgi:hypothetical protein